MFVIPVCVWVFPPYVSFVCLYEDVILEFNSEIEGSHAFCALMLFLCSISCLMCSGSSLHVEWKMMFVKMVFAVCIWW